jgi:DMSO/TMAO reductase YedYZ molybdopterin-dependent catalytic subunit
MFDTTRTTARVPAAISGLVAAGAAVAAAEVVGALMGRSDVTPLLAVGAATVDLTPLPVKQFAVDTFGTADKIALFIGMGAIMTAAAALLGAAAGRRRWIGTAGITVFAVVGLAAVLTRPGAGILDTVPTLAGVAACQLLLALLLNTAARRAPAASRGAMGPGGRGGVGGPGSGSGSDGPSSRSGPTGASGPGSASGLNGPTGIDGINGVGGDSVGDGASGVGGDSGVDASDESGATRAAETSDVAVEPSGSHAAGRPETAEAGGASGEGGPTGERVPDGTATSDATGKSRESDAASTTEAAGADSGASGADGSPGFDRRRFVLLAGSAAALSVGAGTAARLFSASGPGTRTGVGDIRLPRPSDPAAPVPDGADLELDGLSSFFTPNEDFYRIDTALSVPRLDASTWSLRIHGRGVEERTYGYTDLLNRSDLVERDITIACVSNPVGGGYIGNARWIGVPLATLLEEAGAVPPSRGGPADQLVSRSHDGMTIGTPVEDVMDGRDAMLALGMNGEPLPYDHGFPVRMVVPGLYGYVSACKWIVDIELSTFDAFDAYWVPRGWSARGPIKTQSRIDTPQGSDPLTPGTVPVAGVAWAQTTGIDRVEVSVDGGVWQEAELAEEDTTDTWRQWVYEWDAESGDHDITVRATDRGGETQTDDQAPPAPDGATGQHTVRVTVA